MMESSMGWEDSFAAETYGLLKGLEVALELVPDASEVVLRSDCQQAGERTRHAQANTYVAAMERMARERGVTIRHEFVAGADNPADRVSRTEDDRPPPATRPIPAGVAGPLPVKVAETDILDEELDAYEAIRTCGRSANGRRKEFERLRDRVAVRLGIPTREAHPLGLGYVIQQAAGARFVRRLAGGVE